MIFYCFFNLGLINAFAFGWNKETLRRLNRENFKVKTTIKALSYFCFFWPAFVKSPLDPLGCLIGRCTFLEQKHSYHRHYRNDFIISAQYVCVTWTIRSLRIFACLLFRSSIKNEIRIIHVVVVQLQQQTCEKEWCECRVNVLLIKPIVSFLAFSSSPWSSCLPMLKALYYLQLCTTQLSHRAA